MVATKATQKSTAMDYLASPRSEGLVVGIMTLLGYTAPKGGRLPGGVKYDTLVNDGEQNRSASRFKKSWCSKS